MTVPGHALVAHTRPLDSDVDLLDVAGPDGVLFERGRAGLAGRGVARRIAWPGGDPAAAALAAAAELATIDHHDEVGRPGTGPIAFGALPFRPGAPTELIVPEVVVGRSDDGTRWLTIISPADTPEPDEPSSVLCTGSPPMPGDPVHRTGGEAPGRLTGTGPGAGVSPTEFTVSTSVAAEDWCARVAEAAKAEEFTKVVLAREVRVHADKPLDRVAVLRRLRASYPGCYLVSLDGLVGASPELLVSRTGDTVRSHPMAGTAPRGGDPTTDQRLAASLIASTKDREEHQITIDMVYDTLLPWCSYVDYESEPSVVPVANVQHLATMVEGRLSRPAPSVLELVAALHPTPAVAGWPRDPAVAWIEAHEGFDRGRYAGTFGWVDAQGNGTWAVAIRCAEIEGADARVFAGNGIVTDSDPQIELAETQAKLQALLSAIVRP